jgi:dipeptidase E
VAARRFLLASHGLGALPAFLGDESDDPAVLFVNTAAMALAAAGRSGMESDLRALGGLGYDVHELDISGVGEPELERAVDGCDVLFVTGGDMIHLLEHTRASGFGRLVERHVALGKPYVGVSAGAILVGPDVAPVLRDPYEGDTRALELVDVVVLPHADAPGRRERYAEIETRFGGRFTLVQLTDREALVVDDAGTRLVASD